MEPGAGERMDAVSRNRRAWCAASPEAFTSAVVARERALVARERALVVRERDLVARERALVTRREAVISDGVATHDPLRPWRTRGMKAGWVEPTPVCSKCDEEEMDGEWLCWKCAEEASE